MKILYLGRAPLEGEADLDPRRRNLYGDDVVTLGEDGADLNVGPLWHRPAGRWRGPVPDQGLVRRVCRALELEPTGILVIGDHSLALPFLRAGCRFIFDPTDSAALYHMRRIPALIIRSPLKALNSLRLGLYYGRAERALLHDAVGFVTTGPADEQFLRRLAPGAKILRIGNGTPFVRELPLTPIHDGRTIGFHGGMTWEPNREAADRLSGSIARFLAQSPGPPVRIRIAGRPMPEAVQARSGTNGVEVSGFVSDLRAWLSSLSLYVMPMALGAGIKNKLIEAMALGLPVLTNGRGAEALCAEGRQALAIAEGDRNFAAAIRSLLARPDELARMRHDARAYALRNFDWSPHRQAFHAELQRLRSESKL